MWLISRSTVPYYTRKLFTAQQINASCGIDTLLVSSVRLRLIGKQCRRLGGRRLAVPQVIAGRIPGRAVECDMAQKKNAKTLPTDPATLTVLGVGAVLLWQLFGNAAVVQQAGQVIQGCCGK